MVFKELETQHRAFIIKMAWILHGNMYTFWDQMLKGMYFPSRDFLHASKQLCTSWTTNIILVGRCTLPEHGP